MAGRRPTEEYTMPGARRPTVITIIAFLNQQGHVVLLFELALAFSCFLEIVFLVELLWLIFCCGYR